MKKKKSSLTKELTLYPMSSPWNKVLTSSQLTSIVESDEPLTSTFDGASVGATQGKYSTHQEVRLFTLKP